MPDFVKIFNDMELNDNPSKTLIDAYNELKQQARDEKKDFNEVLVEALKNVEVEDSLQTLLRLKAKLDDPKDIAKMGEIEVVLRSKFNLDVAGQEQHLDVDLDQALSMQPVETEFYDSSLIDDSYQKLCKRTERYINSVYESLMALVPASVRVALHEEMELKTSLDRLIPMRDQPQSAEEKSRIDKAVSEYEAARKKTEGLMNASGISDERKNQINGLKEEYVDMSKIQANILSPGAGVFTFQDKMNRMERFSEAIGATAHKPKIPEWKKFLHDVVHIFTQCSKYLNAHYLLAGRAREDLQNYSERRLEDVDRNVAAATRPKK